MKLALVLAEVLLAGAALASLSSCADARAVSPVRVGRIDDVRLGFGLDLEGQVGRGCTASKFALRDPIHLSLRVLGAGPGSVVHVSVRNIATRRTEWKEDRPAPAGRSTLTFELGRSLPEGRYRAEATLGDDAMHPQAFIVHAWHDNAR